ncbi:MAG TPA: zf-HC2 domain-containing protein [Blastocatellia bacterium]|nr:zf-HC2 domain-containing protein [Blastocatellia bacterium]
MSEQTGTINCRETRRRFSALADLSRTDLSGTDRAATERHLQTCERCAREHRLFKLGRAALDLAASSEAVRPDNDFYAALRARIARGPAAENLPPVANESWAAAVFLTARQLIPAMAVLLLLIIGATLISKSAPAETDRAELRPRERVLFNQLYDYPEPTPDDVLETLVAVEEKENGK